MIPGFLSQELTWRLTTLITLYGSPDKMVHINHTLMAYTVVYRIIEPSHKRAFGLIEPFSWLPIFY